jgi:Tfp pilus assembly protein PilO
LLNDLKIRIEDLERYKERFETLSWEFKALQTKVDAFPNTYATKAELECLNTTLDAIQRQLTSNTALFNTLL